MYASSFTSYKTYLFPRQAIFINANIFQVTKSEQTAETDYYNTNCITETTFQQLNGCTLRLYSVGVGM